MNTISKILVFTLTFFITIILYSINIFSFCEISGISFSSIYLTLYAIICIYFLLELIFYVIYSKKKQELKINNIPLIKYVLATIFIFLMTLLIIIISSTGLDLLEKTYSVALSVFVVITIGRFYKLNSKSKHTITFYVRAVMNVIIILIVGWFGILLFKDLFMYNTVICKNQLSTPSTFEFNKIK